MCTLVGWGVPDLARLRSLADLERDGDFFLRSRDLDLDGERFLAGEGDFFFLGGGEAERLRGGGDALRAGGGDVFLAGGVPFFSGFFAAGFSSFLDFSPPFFFPFFLSLDLERDESELLELESLLLLLLLELLCFLFFLDLSLSLLDFLSSSLELEELDDLSRFFLSPSLSSFFLVGCGDPRHCLEIVHLPGCRHLYSRSSLLQYLL